MAVTIPASKFKATCLQLIDDVATSGGEVTITKHGRPVARLVPISGASGSLLGSVLADDRDVMAPIDETWFADE
jgi:prevent-host-death family protein